MKSSTKSLVGSAMWATYVVLSVRNLNQGVWVHALLLLAALVLVPLVLDLLGDELEDEASARLVRWAGGAQFPAAVLLALSCLLPVGGWAAIAATPWVGVCSLIAVAGCLRLTQESAERSLDRLCADVAMIFLGIGGAWVFADRAGFTPLNFSPAIVELTAAHFHFAGLLLTLFAALIVRALPGSRFASVAAVAVVLAVPAVAIGITTSQLGWGTLMEAIAGGGLALAGAAVATLHLRIAFLAGVSTGARAGFLIAGASLLAGMFFAALYALRSFVMPLPWLDLPSMRALHGTANALGFGLCGTLAWRRFQCGAGR